jgi:hypothetical protein
LLLVLLPPAAALVPYIHIIVTSTRIIFVVVGVVCCSSASPTQRPATDAMARKFHSASTLHSNPGLPNTQTIVDDVFAYIPYTK